VGVAEGVAAGRAVVVEGAGHDGHYVNITSELIRATDRFAAR